MKFIYLKENNNYNYSSTFTCYSCKYNYFIIQAKITIFENVRSYNNIKILNKARDVFKKYPFVFDVHGVFFIVIRQFLFDL